MINPLRLANEWRDTLFYSGIALVVLIAVMSGETIPWHYGVLLPTVGRECVRQWLWILSPPMQWAGTTARPANIFDLACATGFVILTLDGLDMLFWDLPQYMAHQGSKPLGVIVGMLSLCSFFGAFAFARIGLQGVVRAYTETMWDWPRRQDGGGETQKLVDAVKAWGGRQLPLATGA
jgi:hypothetical protein